MSAVRDAAARIDAIAVPLSLERLERLGELESGCNNFYAVRLRRGTIFSDYDLALAEALVARSDLPRVVHEVGGGFGNLSMLLAMNGFQATCLELAKLRYDGGMAILEALRPALPQMANFRLLHAAFPEPTLKPDGAMAVITNLVATTSEADRRAMLRRLGAYDAAIIDVDRFLTSITTAPERETRLADFAAHGLTGEPFLDCGTSACFYLFHGERPAQGDGLMSRMKRLFARA